MRDLTPDGKFYRNILEIKGEHLVDFSYETYFANQVDYPGYNALFRIIKTKLTYKGLRMSSIQVIYLHRFINEIKDYIMSFPAMKMLLSTTAQRAAEVAKDAVEKASNKCETL